MNVAILGGGQLGRMLALEGIPLGARFRFLEPSLDPPAGLVGRVVSKNYDDPEGLREVSDGADVVTYEFENVPVASARQLDLWTTVLPPTAALEMAQDRLAEKRGFRSIAIPTAAFHPVGSEAELAAALREVGLPAVLKTTRFGYDGKGQTVACDEDEAIRFVKAANGPLIAESLVGFDRELSLIAVAGRERQRRYYPLTENHHSDGILRVSYAPAEGVSSDLREKAHAIADALIDHLGYVGVLAIELFQVGGELLANEIAPRVHNSGHWTLDGAVVSQFENHIRAVTGLPLGDTTALGPVAMVNLIGSSPEPARVLEVEGAHLHLYDKPPRPGRKVGHVNVTGADWGEVKDRVGQLQAVLGSGTTLPAPLGPR